MLGPAASTDNGYGADAWLQNEHLHSVQHILSNGTLRTTMKRHRKSGMPGDKEQVATVRSLAESRSAAIKSPISGIASIPDVTADNPRHALKLGIQFPLF
jgi:hypothetical protein